MNSYQRKNKVSGFSLIEIMVVMVIGGTLVSLSLLLYFKLNVHLKSLSKANSMDYQLAFLNSSMQRDADLSDIMKYNDYFKKLQFIKDDEIISTYHFEKDKIILEKNRFKEEFNVAPVSLDYVKNKSQQLLTNKLSFEVLIDSKLAYSIVIVKRYAPEQLFKFENEQ